MIPNISLPIKEFQEQLIKYSFEYDSNLSRKLKTECNKFELGPVLKKTLSDETVRSYLNSNKRSILSLLLIANIAYHLKQPHIVWMYLAYARKLNGNERELEKCFEVSRNYFLTTFPFANDLKKYLDYLTEKYVYTKKEQIVILKNETHAFELVEKLRKLKKFEISLALSIVCVKRFSIEFLHFVSINLYSLGYTNEALKALVLLTYHNPIGANQFSIWGKISVELASAKNYYAIKLGSIIYPDNYSILLNMAGSGASYEENKSALEILIKSYPKDPAVLLNYANVLNSEGKPRESVDLLKKASLYSNAYSPKVESNLLFISQYCQDVDFCELKDMHVRSCDRLKENSEFLTSIKDKDRPFSKMGPRLRVGFVSFDLINHPVSYYLYPLLKNLDQSRLDLYIFYNQKRKDGVTKLFMDIVGENWYEIGELDTSKAYNLIRSKEIDVLVDLSGHTAGNRLELFAARSAPIQCTYLGYPFTTGLAEIDYRFSDHILPDNDNIFFTEKRYNIFPCSACYQPLVSRMHLVGSDAYSVKPPPVIKNGYITFGLSTNPAKINDNVVIAFCNILQGVPYSKLLVEANGFRDKTYLDSFVNRFVSRGIDINRLVLVQRDGANQYLTYNDIDIALDPFPYNGGTSTLDLLWMGLPLVTLRGLVGMSAAGVHMLGHLNRKEWIADTVSQYVSIAINLALDPIYLNETRLAQRERMENSPLMDYAGVGLGFTNAFLQMAGRQDLLAN